MLDVVEFGHRSGFDRDREFDVTDQDHGELQAITGGGWETQKDGRCAEKSNILLPTQAPRISRQRELTVGIG